MTKRLQVLYAVKDMIQTAVGPFVTVVGLENAGAVPAFIPDPELALAGRVVIRAGDPGTPTQSMSPPSYFYEHQIPIEIETYAATDGSATAEEQLDTLIGAISGAIAEDRFLGGNVEYLDGFSPATDDLFVTGAKPARMADLTLVATYTTTSPL